MLEVSEDMALDIPLFWDYFAACVSPMVVEGSLTLTAFAGLATKASDKAPKCVARVMAHCAKMSSVGRASDLWSQAGLCWTSLGLEESTVTEFVKAEVWYLCVSYLCSENIFFVVHRGFSSFRLSQCHRGLVSMTNLTCMTLLHNFALRRTLTTFSAG